MAHEIGVLHSDFRTQRDPSPEAQDDNFLNSDLLGAQRSTVNELKYLTGYPEPLIEQVRALIAENRVNDVLQKRYPEANAVRTDAALRDYTLSLKSEFMKSAIAPAKVVFDTRLQVMRHALGTHTQISRLQGTKLVAKREIRIASVFIDAPAAFLKMIVVHELAHLREREHNKAFYQLCRHMEPDYAQLEFDLRLYLTHLELSSSMLQIAAK